MGRTEPRPGVRARGWRPVRASAVAAARPDGSARGEGSRRSRSSSVAPAGTRCAAVEWHVRHGCRGQRDARPRCAAWVRHRRPPLHSLAERSAGVSLHARATSGAPVGGVPLEPRGCRGAWRTARRGGKGAHVRGVPPWRRRGRGATLLAIWERILVASRFAPSSGTFAMDIGVNVTLDAPAPRGSARRPASPPPHRAVRTRLAPRARRERGAAGR
jgi:hypothetical protein